MAGLAKKIASTGKNLVSHGVDAATSSVGERGNAAMAGLMPGLGGMLPGLPGLDDLGGLLPSLPIPEIPIPGMPSMPSLPDFDLPSIGLPDFGISEGITEGVESLGNLWDEEGVDMLLDPRGAVDRSAAREELASRFQVVGDDFVGPRLGHQVTADEYEDIVRQYSDIRLGRTDIDIDTDGLSEEDAAAFRSGTMSDIADILQTSSGRQLVDSLADAPGHGLFNMFDTTTTITRRNDAAGNPDPSNATGGGVFGKSGNVNYVPGVDTVPGGANIRSDVTLYHEMMHAHHAVYNTWNNDTVTAATGGVPSDVASGIREAEYQAAGLGQYANDPMSENRYRAERAQIGASNFGERTSGFETDDTMSHRDVYGGFSPGGTPARMPGAPGTPIPGVTPSGGSTGGAGDASRIGQSTDHDHHHG